MILACKQVYVPRNISFGKKLDKILFWADFLLSSEMEWFSFVLAEFQIQSLALKWLKNPFPWKCKN